MHVCMSVCLSVCNVLSVLYCIEWHRRVGMVLYDIYYCIVLYCIVLCCIV